MILATAAIPAAAAAPAGAARAFPVPTCSWADAKMVGGYLHVALKRPAGSWSTVIAPVLSCAYFERAAKLEPTGAPLVTIRFRELQRFKPPAGWTSVGHLGSCVSGVSCPAAGQPAWVSHSFALTSNQPDAVPFVSGVTLEVEDGLNCLTVTINNPRGPLRVANGETQAERIAKRLLPRFYWH